MAEDLRFLFNRPANYSSAESVQTAIYHNGAVERSMVTKLSSNSGEITSIIQFPKTPDRFQLSVDTFKDKRHHRMEMCCIPGAVEANFLIYDQDQPEVNPILVAYAESNNEMDLFYLPDVGKILPAAPDYSYGQLMHSEEHIVIPHDLPIQFGNQVIYLHSNPQVHLQMSTQIRHGLQNYKVKLSVPWFQSTIFHRELEQMLANATPFHTISDFIRNFGYGFEVKPIPYIR